MKFKNYLKESTRIGGKIDRPGSRGIVPTQNSITGKSKQSAKNFLYKQIKPFTHNRFYKDDFWEGPKNVWQLFDKLGLNWQIDKSEYQKGQKRMGEDPNLDYRKVWWFTIWLDDGKNKIQGYLTAAGAGSVEDPLEKYDVVVVMN